MNKTPLVSVIIPNYNTEKFLAETINSVINQTYTNWELLIVDDHSSDKSVEIIRSFSDKYPNISFLKTITNSGGPATPRNVGIDASKGIYIAFLDSDDTWFPKKLEFHMNFMLRENSNFSSTYRNNFSLPAQAHWSLNKNLKLKVYSFKELLKKNLIDTSAVIIKKDIIGDIRFDPSPSLIAIEDYDFWLKILKARDEKILVSKVETINYRITGENISRSKIKMAMKFFHVLRKHEVSFFMSLYYFFNYSILSIIYLTKRR